MKTKCNTGSQTENALQKSKDSQTFDLIDTEEAYAQTNLMLKASSETTVKPSKVSEQTRSDSLSKSSPKREDLSGVSLDEMIRRDKRASKPSKLDVKKDHDNLVD